MPRIALQIKVNLENVTNLHFPDDDFRWYLKLKCANCGEETKEFVYVCLAESRPLKGGRGSASLVTKCKLCSRENSIDILKDLISPYDADSSGDFKKIVVFDCRGVEPTDFSPRTGFAAEAVDSGTVFSDIDLSQKDWADYDERGEQTVGIYDLEFRFVSFRH
ncbi:CXXC motif containing zinc binding protein-like [Oscarella lobularis]|uniref:CXXC motif containing zinc binding protein-like n=1 Tax=Oscarella lobularis TaxID=121494 RepID=UPI003313BC79